MSEQQKLQMSPSVKDEPVSELKDPVEPDIVPEEEDITPSINDKAYRRAGMLVLLICFGGGGIWASLAPLDSAIVSIGQVKVESSRKTVQHLEGGIVSQILVEDGDLVVKGQALLSLDDTQARAKLDSIRWQSYSEQAQLARLKAERDGQEKVSFSSFPDLLIDDTEIEELRRQESRLFKFRKEFLEGELAVLEQRKRQFQEQIQGLKAVAKIKRQRIELFKEEIAEWKSLFERQLTDKLQLRQIKHQKLALEGEVAEHSAQIAQLVIQSGETQAQILLRKQQFMTDVLQQLRKGQVSLADQRIRLVSLSDRLTRTSINAPESGVVVGLDVHTIGAVITAGNPILHIVPQTKDFVVESRIDTTEIDRVLANQVADIRFSAFDSKVTQVIEGQVKRVSADSYTDDRSGATYYEVTLEVTESGVEQMSRDGIELVSGMPAEVMIKTGGRTLLEYIVQPFSDMLARTFKEE